ncbi:MAG: hypothetical protein F4X82_00175 [Candidatus Spechtbacteria bacterium SB0662_bin_43]|uniref:Fido domain-containing protein n=1 Tax=Candidatus Spechtbacteria bacterium SB0662_bin_43 TaxID=2604897 RepID=A0A845DA63_9BACT|nr:hypothetical protein [Candidatus Spechtbacteria bacterium SB0662_bin_43]
MVLQLPDKDSYKNFIEYCSRNRNKDIFSIFNKEDPYDKTTVFDFIDNHWIDYTYSNIEKVIRSDLYKGDGTIEYRIAYICVELNLLHALPNGNKRTSIFVMWILLFLNFSSNTANNIGNILTNMDSEYIYNFAKHIASEGAKSRERNIQDLTQYLKNLSQQ